MFKYKKIVIFLVVSVLLLGSAILYTVLSGMDSENTVYNIQQKTNYQKEKEVDENSDYDTVSTDNVNEQIDGIVSGYLNAKLDDNISGMKKYVNYIKVIDEKNILVRTWERGCGYTLGCGTGITASVIISNYLKKVKDSVKVTSEGGSIIIDFIDNEAYMTGKAIKICEGNLEV